MKKLLIKISGFFGIAILWEIGARILSSPIFPPLSRVLPKMMSLLLGGDVWIHIGVSLLHIFLGFGLAVIFAGTLGVAMSQFKVVKMIWTPIIDTMRPIAALTLFPLLIILFGLGIWSKVFVIFWTAWPAMVLNTIHGIYQVDPSLLEAAQLDGADRWTLLRKISFPLAIPTIMTGLRIGMSGGWISLVAAEMLGSSQGLGYSVLSYSQSFQFPEMYATIILIAMLGLTINSLMGLAQDWLDYERNITPNEHLLSDGYLVMFTVRYSNIMRAESKKRFV